jgi:hypothetical protein
MSERPQLIGRIAQAVRELPRNAGQQGSSSLRVFVQNDLGGFSSWAWSLRRGPGSTGLAHDGQIFRR